MLKDRRTLLLFALVAFVAIWIQWWASSGFPLTHQICSEGQAAEDCASYNVFFYSAWRLAIAANYWGILFTAVATIAIAGFTFTLWQSTEKLWNASNMSLHFANMEFTSSHRPQLRLKHLWLATADGERFYGQIQAKTAITVRLDIVNVGAVAANITLINFVTLILAKGLRLPQRPPYNEPDVLQFPINFRLEPGMTFTHAVSDGRVLTNAEIIAIQKVEARLYFVGSIDYWDDARRPRGTAFCRYLKFDSIPARHSGRFEKEEDPDYEYQD